MKKLYAAKFSNGEVIMTTTKKRLHRCIKECKQLFYDRAQVVRFVRGWTETECWDKLEN